MLLQLTRCINYLVAYLPCCFIVGKDCQSEIWTCQVILSWGGRSKFQQK